MSDKPLQQIQLTGVSTRELNNDVVSISFEATKEGKDAATVQKELRDAVQNALETIRLDLVPDEADVTTDSFQVQPRYGKSGKMDGYLGNAQITIKGTDTAKIAQMASDIKTMVVSSSKNSMSRKLKQSVEAELSAEAIADFSSKADAIATAFGYKSWTLGSVSVSVNADRSYGGSGKVMAMGASLESGGTMSVESGKSTLNGQVHGTIILSRTKRT